MLIGNRIGSPIRAFEVSTSTIEPLANLSPLWQLVSRNGKGHSLNPSSLGLKVASVTVIVFSELLSSVRATVEWLDGRPMQKIEQEVICKAGIGRGAGGLVTTSTFRGDSGGVMVTGTPLGKVTSDADGRKCWIINPTKGTDATRTFHTLRDIANLLELAGCLEYWRPKPAQSVRFHQPPF